MKLTWFKDKYNMVLCACLTVIASVGCWAIYRAATMKRETPKNCGCQDNSSTIIMPLPLRSAAGI